MSMNLSCTSHCNHILVSVSSPWRCTRVLCRTQSSKYMWWRGHYPSQAILCVSIMTVARQVWYWSWLLKQTLSAQSSQPPLTTNPVVSARARVLRYSWLPVLTSYQVLLHDTSQSAKAATQDIVYTSTKKTCSTSTISLTPLTTEFSEYFLTFHLGR